MSLICPNCDKGTISPNNSCLCPSCAASFIKIGESVYVREDALQKAAKIVEETDKRLARIVKERGVNDLTGNEGEEAGVVSGRKSRSIILVNDFVVTGSPGSNGYSDEPVLALDEDREKSNLLCAIRKLYSEKRIKLRLLLLHESELEKIEEEAKMDEKSFRDELSRLIKAGQERKVGTFHSHESSGSAPSDEDIRILKLQDGTFEREAFGKNDTIEVILSEHLIVLEKGSAREIGRIALTDSASYDFQYNE